MINPVEVEKIFVDCLFKSEEEITSGNSTIIEAVRADYYIDNRRLSKHSKVIEGWLKQLDLRFQKGASFLELCTDKDGEVWTSEHAIMENLMILGLAIGKVEYCTPDREMWSKLPGGMPYIFVRI